jgi:hypothetical protein
MNPLVQKAIDILSPIEEDRWCVGVSGKEYTEGICCAMNHLALGGFITDDRYKLNQLSLKKKQILIISVNDGRALELYPQPTAKKRTLALLNDLNK